MKRYFVITIIVLFGILGFFFYTKNPIVNNSALARKTLTPEEQSAVEQLVSSEKYSHQNPAFSFLYPKGTSVNEESIEGGQLIIVRYPAIDVGFQIFIRHIEEKSFDITPERLKEELPDLVFRDPQEVIMGTSGKGLAFISKEEGVEKREVWFAYNNSLYQITAPMYSDGFLQKVLNTWQFISS